MMQYKSEYVEKLRAKVCGEWKRGRKSTNNFK